jgi:hypothetical protein
MPLSSHLGQRIKNREIRQGLELGLLSQHNDWQAEAVVEQRWTQAAGLGGLHFVSRWK